MLIERVVLGLNAALRRRWLLLAPLMIIPPIVALLAYATPVKFVAKSVILLQSANRANTPGVAAGNSFPRQVVIEQVSVIEAWLKSDHVLGNLLPQLLDDEIPTDPQEQVIELTKLRKALTLELVGNSVLELRLESSKAKGLGRKVEIIVSRLLEGMLSPDDGVLSAERMVAIRRGEALNEVELALNTAIEVSGLGSVEVVRTKLSQMYALQKEIAHRSISSLSDGRTIVAPAIAPERTVSTTDAGVRGGLARPVDKTKLVQQLAADRAALSADVRVIDRLEKHFAAYEEARSAFEVAKQNANAKTDTYVRVFDSPAALTVVGRPRDPLIGESNRRKMFIAGVFLSLILGAGLVVLAELLDYRLHSRSDFERIAGVPVITRLSKVDQDEAEGVDDETSAMKTPPTLIERFARNFKRVGAKKIAQNES